MKTTIKTIVKTALIVFTLVGVFNCSKDDPAPNPIAQPEPDPTPIPENKMPTAAVLVSPAQDAINVSVTPALSWEASTDEDDDTITYDVYADSETNPSTLITTTNGTSFQISERLGLKEKFNWKVVAKDNNGGENESAIGNFETRNILFSNATQNASFPGRTRFGATVFNGRIWVSGGFQEGFLFQERSNDVWNSSDGVNWTQVTAEATWSKRMAHEMIAFDGKLWVIGGIAETIPGMPTERLADVWNSEDGINWNLVTDSPGFGKVSGSALSVYDNKMWLIHGDKVWFSEDGVVWTLASEGAIGMERQDPSSLVFNNKIWIIGGTREEEGIVISSSDGISWEIESDAPQFNEDGFRNSHSSVVFDNKMWIIGGFNRLYNGKDVWYSKNGKDWILATDEAAFIGRVSHESVIFNNKIWVIAGDDLLNNDDSERNDVWFID